MLLFLTASALSCWRSLFRSDCSCLFRRFPSQYQADPCFSCAAVYFIRNIYTTFTNTCTKIIFHEHFYNHCTQSPEAVWMLTSCSGLFLGKITLKFLLTLDYSSTTILQHCVFAAFYSILFYSKNLLWYRKDHSFFLTCFFSFLLDCSTVSILKINITYSPLLCIQTPIWSEFYFCGGYCKRINLRSIFTNIEDRIVTRWWNIFAS